jgi:TRAP-type C4-dicarboxylate transport system substrate-binding protein
MVRAISTLAALSILLGCGGAEKVSGVRAERITTLTLANPNEGPGDLQPFVDEVRALSDGRVRIRVLSDWREGEPGFESGLIDDVRSGRAQLGWVGTRAWSAQGAHSLDALAAPFAIDSYEAEAAALRAANDERLPAGLAAAGVEPVGVVPGPLRLLLARRPIQQASDLEGLTIGVAASAIGERALRSAGALPVPLARGGSMSALDAVEARLGDLVSYTGRARYLSVDAPLWPAPRVIFANRGTWDQLSEDERAVLRSAAERASGPMFRDIEADDRAAMTQLCNGGVRLVSLSPRARESLRRAVASEYEKLRRSADSRAGLEVVERASVRGETLPQATCAAASPSNERALTGTFEWTLRRGEPEAEIVGIGAAPSLRFRLELRTGRAVQTAVFPDGHSEPGFDERYEVYRDRITFGGDHGPPDTARWRLDGDKLTFSEFSDDDPVGRVIWESHTWIRVDR